MLDRDQWIALGMSTAQVVADKNAAYGDSVRSSAKIMQTLYPNGVSVEQIPAMLVTVRIVDKLSRIANDPGFGNEDPAQDITGYGLLLQDLWANGLNPECHEQDIRPISDGNSPEPYDGYESEIDTQK